jgi:hypothetical protein
VKGFISLQGVEMGWGGGAQTVWKRGGVGAGV